MDLNTSRPFFLLGSFIVDFSFGKDMKKLLIIIFPLCTILSIFMWISWGLEGVLTFFGVVLFVVTATIGLVKWIEFVDKHIKD